MCRIGLVGSGWVRLTLNSPLSSGCWWLCWTMLGSCISLPTSLWIRSKCCKLPGKLILLLEVTSLNLTFRDLMPNKIEIYFNLFCAIMKHRFTTIFKAALLSKNRIVDYSCFIAISPMSPLIKITSTTADPLPYTLLMRMIVNCVLSIYFPQS